MRGLACLLLTCISGAASAQTLKLAACTLNTVERLCGSFSVPEDRERPERRTIGLRIFVVPAASKRPDPLFPIEGGPGNSTVEHLSDPSLLPVYRQIAGDRDIVAIEERG